MHDRADRERFEETLAEVVEASGCVAQRLTMGARNAVSRTIRLAAERVETDRNAQRFAQRTDKNVKSF